MSNQKAKSDDGKAKLLLVPRRIIFDIAKIREYGNNKYPEGGPDNWKQVEPERYRDAAFRHFLAYLDDPYGLDDESGLPHLWHLACNVAFLCEMEDSKILNMTRERQIGEVAHGDVIGNKVCANADGMEKSLHWKHSGPIIAKRIKENEDGTFTVKVNREGMKALGVDYDGPTLSDDELYEIPAESNYTKWHRAWRETDGETEYYRTNVISGKVQFGDYDFESGTIVPRKGAKYE